ncbi:hypothetical protein HA402_013981 [Bradysia odoriphaga]|nr:hypothetical protein HA402_013981 [Bradysia odoriphaga]
MMQTLLHKKALLTGATGGIGQAIAKQLAAHGTEIVLHYHGPEEAAKSLAGAITAAGGKAHILPADLSDAGQAIRLGEEAWTLMNGIDFLINNAGVSYKKHFLDTTPEDVDHFININFKGTLWLTQTVAKKMVQSSTEGSIYTITSINGIQPGVGLSVYGATKAALETLMKGIALELAPHNIKVNTIAPGGIATPLNAAVWQDEALLKTVNENIPMGRLGQPEEMAAVICSLLASGSYMTGTTVTIDGGWMLKHGYARPEKYSTRK